MLYIPLSIEWCLPKLFFEHYLIEEADLSRCFKPIFFLKYLFVVFMELTIDQRPLKFLHLDLFSDNIPFLLYFFHFTPNYSF